MAVPFEFTNLCLDAHSYSLSISREMPKSALRQHCSHIPRSTRLRTSPDRRQIEKCCWWCVIARRNGFITESSVHFKDICETNKDISRALSRYTAMVTVCLRNQRQTTAHACSTRVNL